MVNVWVDGSVKGKIAGWGAVIIYRGTLMEVYGTTYSMASTRIELLAAVEGLKLSGRHESKCVSIYSDCTYVVEGFVKHVFGPYEAKKDGDLWAEIRAYIKQKNINVYCFWVKGHRNHGYNLKADRLAKTAVESRRGLGKKNHKGLYY